MINKWGLIFTHPIMNKEANFDSHYLKKKRYLKNVTIRKKHLGFQVETAAKLN